MWIKNNQFSVETNTNTNTNEKLIIFNCINKYYIILYYSHVQEKRERHIQDRWNPI